MRNRIWIYLSGDGNVNIKVPGWKQPEYNAVLLSDNYLTT